jgi:hypothetical protein
MRLFDESDTTLPLSLIKSETFKTGVMYLVYGPAESTPEGTYDAAVKAMSQGEQ